MARGPVSDTSSSKRDDEDDAQFHDIESGGGAAGGDEAGAAASSSSSSSLSSSVDRIRGKPQGTFAQLPVSYGDVRPPQQMAEAKDERVIIGR